MPRLAQYSSLGSRGDVSRSPARSFDRPGVDEAPRTSDGNATGLRSAEAHSGGGAWRAGSRDAFGVVGVVGLLAAGGVIAALALAGVIMMITLIGHPTP